MVQQVLPDGVYLILVRLQDDAHPRILVRVDTVTPGAALNVFYLSPDLLLLFSGGVSRGPSATGGYGTRRVRRRRVPALRRASAGRPRIGSSPSMTAASTARRALLRVFLVNRRPFGVDQTLIGRPPSLARPAHGGGSSPLVSSPSSPVGCRSGRRFRHWRAKLQLKQLKIGFLHNLPHPRKRSKVWENALFSRFSCTWVC